MRGSLRRLSRSSRWFLASGLLASSCIQGSAEPSSKLSVQIAPLTLPGVVDACYTLTVKNDVGQTVSSRGDLCASQFGANGGLTYVATCDATDSDSDGTATNVVKLTIDGLYAGAGKTSPITEFMNPCAPPHAVDGCQLSANCVENADAAIVFNLTLMREANQGFFDIGVSFDDIFCSAKLDCTNSTGGPLNLLHHPTTLERGQTAVVAMACTSGPGGSTTHLLRNPIEIECQSGNVTLDPGAGKGNRYGSGPGQMADPDLSDAVWQYAVYAGTESLVCGGQPCDKTYWNVAVGFSTNARNCILTTTATAIDASSSFSTPASSTYPYVNWSVPLTTDSVSPALACSKHPLNGSPSGVSTLYTDIATTRSFENKFDGVDFSTGGSINLAVNPTVTVTVAYNSAGGSACANKTVTVGSAYGALCSPTLSGFIFGGWWTGENGTGTQVLATSTVTTEVSHTLYAKWSSSTCLVHFNSDGGSACADKLATVGSTYGTLCTPTRLGFAFVGWFSGADGTGSQVTTTSTVSTSEEHTLFASWNPVFPTGNILINPGAETGSLSPWTTDGDFLLYTFTGSLTTSGDTISPTQGTNWFRGNGATGAGVSPNWKQGRLRQVVDIRDFVGSSTLQVAAGGDAFATSDRSPPSTSTDAWFGVEFLNSSSVSISTVSSATVLSTTTSPENAYDVRFTATVPAGTAFIRFTAVAFEGTIHNTRHGFDDLFLELRLL